MPNVNVGDKVFFMSPDYALNEETLKWEEVIRPFEAVVAWTYELDQGLLDLYIPLAQNQSMIVHKSPFVADGSRVGSWHVVPVEQPQAQPVNTDAQVTPDPNPAPPVDQPTEPAPEQQPQQ
jgi:hypothetical protein